MDLKTLIKQRATHKAKVTQFKSYIDTLDSCPKLSTLQISELNIRLSKIEELYSDYDTIQSDIENISEIPDDQYAERESFESRYFWVVALARELLLRGAAAAGAGSCCRSVSGSGTAHQGGPKLI